MIKSRAASQAPSPTPPQSIDAVRRRARHRLIGASMLVLVGVVGFSLLFDTEPRPIAVDIPIEIPAKAVPAAPAVSPSAPVVAHAPEQPEAEKPAEKAPEPVADTQPADPPAQAETERTVAVVPPADPPPVLAPATPSNASASSKTTPDGSGAASAAGSSGADGTGLRLVVQVGAFAETARAQEVRQKIERAGMKTYTHVAQTSQGKRIRVRLGPFPSRAEAERAAARVKALGYPAAILTL